MQRILNKDLQEVSTERINRNDTCIRNEFLLQLDSIIPVKKVHDEVTARHSVEGNLVEINYDEELALEDIVLNPEWDESEVVINSHAEVQRVSIVMINDISKMEMVQEK